MENRIQQALRRISASTFEEMAFLTVDEDPSCDNHGSGDGHSPRSEGIFSSTLAGVSLAPEAGSLFEPLGCSVRVDFEGDPPGTLVLSASEPVVREVVTSMLGTDDEPSPGMMRDALGEAANVLCGNLLGELFEYRSQFRLLPPVVGSRANGTLVAQVSLAVDPGEVRSALYFEKPDSRKAEDLVSGRLDREELS